VSNPNVREVGSVTCVHGSVLRVGVDHDAVTVGGVQLGPEARDDFARLYLQADEEARAWAAANAGDEGAAGAVTPGQLLALVYPCCKHCERERELTGAGPCVPPGHLARCTNGCDDEAVGRG
jgi:hypothetical protein